MTVAASAILMRASHSLVVVVLLASSDSLAAQDISSAVPKPSPETSAMTRLDLTKCLRSGERLVFRVHIKVMFISYPGAGETRIETIGEDALGTSHIRVIANTATQGKVWKAYKYRNDSVSLIDATTGRLLETQTTGIDGDRSIDELTAFDHAAGTMIHTDNLRPPMSHTSALPAQPVADLTVTMLCVRFWDLDVGQTRDIVLAYEGDFYNLRVNADREETVKTALGTFSAVVLEPKQQGELKGAFKKGVHFTFYVSKGERPQLVRIDTRRKLLTFVGVLERIENKEGLSAAPSETH